ncbi:MAG TPA: hypothetical protein VGA73_09700, partial [Candidatus Binatia bacterium]
MNYWEQVQTAAGMEGAFPWVVLGILLAAFLLFSFVPAERARVRASLFLFGFSLIGLLAAGGFLAFGATPEHFGYRAVRWAALSLCGIAVVNLAGVFLFDVCLNRLY